MDRPLLTESREEARGAGDTDAVGADAPSSLPPPAEPGPLDAVADDFSLQSRGIRFRAGREMKIYEQAGGQLILEDQGTEEPDAADKGEGRGGRKIGGILVRATNDTGYAHGFLRAAYSLVAILVGGFIFIVGFDILLFLFIDVANQMGLTTEGSFRLVPLFAVLLSVPVFVYSLAMGMTLVGKLVVDTFNGHPFLRSFGLGVVTTDWLAFVMYLGIPIVTFIVTLFREMENYWEVTLLTWFMSILLFWGFFSACVIYLEVWACLELVEEDNHSVLGDAETWGVRCLYWAAKATQATMRTMRYRLAGKRTHLKKMSTKRAARASKMLPSQGPYSWLANLKGNPCFRQAQPKRIHTLNEALGNTYYVTSQSWSLEKLFGNSSITEAQINSNIACNLLGNLVVALVFVGAVVWFELPPAAHWMACIVALVFFVWVAFSTRRMFRLREDIVNDENATLYRFHEVFQYSAPKEGFVLAAISLQVFFLYVVPLVYLAVENPPLALVFALLGIFVSLRHYLNPGILLLEHDKEGYLRNTRPASTKREKKAWTKKSRLYHLVAVGGDTARHFWTITYVVCVMIFIALAVLAANEDTGDQSATDQSSMTFYPKGYGYPPQPNLAYPTCEVKFGGNNLQLADFAFLSALAYRTNEFASNTLQTWFGDNETSNNVDLIQKFHEATNCEDYGCSNPVGYKLITFPDSSAVLTIRGTKTAWDAIADAQLWASAVLFQGLRFILPFSEIFTPILHHMVSFVSLIQSKSIAKVAYYRETVGFINYLKEISFLKTSEVEGLTQLVVTGHSLGGGLAIITGAQSKTSAVALSGVNAMLSRNSFLPPITAESLNTLTFNVIPDNDPVPRFDDKARLYQRIKCTAKTQDVIGCHSITRSLCEIQYTCGSINPDRPVPCECVFDYGYPEPSLATSNQTARTAFTQSCIDICYEANSSTETCERWRNSIKSNASVSPRET